MVGKLTDEQCEHWPICPNCEGGLSSTDINEAQRCTQCNYPLTESENEGR